MCAKGIDVLSYVWDFPGVLYAFPPSPLLAAVLGRIRETSCPVLLLAATWPRQSWYSSLVELSVAHAVRLPLEQFPLLQGYFTHQSSKIFKIHT